jgi:hypothetical protein
MHQATRGGITKTKPTSQNQIDITIAIYVIGRRIDIGGGNCADTVFFPARVFVPDKLRRIDGKRNNV